MRSELGQRTPFLGWLYRETESNTNYLEGSLSLTHTHLFSLEVRLNNRSGPDVSCPAKRICLRKIYGFVSK